MKNPWNNMISLLPLPEFMPLIFVQEKLRAFALCSIFYVDSLHTTWILHQVPPKLLRFSICIELLAALMPTIPWVSPPLSLIFTSTQRVPSYDVAMVTPSTSSRNASTNVLLHSRSYNDSSLLTRSIELCGDTVLRYSSSTCVVCCT
ncbi:hypothetical protein BHM03_00037088 [Ensete ventricosum]|nr:hypothetical protein BHM03_00037088 [Ensete ventricosum]